MKVYYLNNQYPKVSHTFIRREIQALEKMGLQVLRVCARQNSEGLVDQADIDEIKITESIAQGKIAKVLGATAATKILHPLRYLKALATCIKLGLKDDFKIIKYCIYLAEACYLLKLCKENNVEHIHAHFGTNPTTVALLTRLLGGPTYSFTVHGPEEFDRPLSLSLTTKIKHSAFVVAISYFCQSQLYRWCESLEEWNKIKIVRCALGEESFLNTLPIAKHNRSLLAIGRLCEQKGFPLLLQAASMLKKDGINFKLNIVGDGPMRSEIEKVISDEGLNDCVTLLGYKAGAEVIDLLDSSCGLIVPSFAEGLPVVIMEALARKRPVIATQIAAISELVENGKNGWIIPPGNTNALYHAMQELIDSPTEALNEMGNAGWQQTREQHNSETEAKKLFQQFNLTN